MLSCATVVAQRDYKKKHTINAPKTLMYKGFPLARTRAEPARPRSRARSARARARSARVLPCGTKSWRPKGGTFRSPLGLPPSSMRHNVLAKSCRPLTNAGGKAPRTPLTAPPRKAGSSAGAAGRSLQDPLHTPPALPGSALSGWVPAKARTHVVYRLARRTAGGRPPAPP